MPSAVKSNENIDVFNGITLLKNRHPDIKRLMASIDIHTHHGHKVWNTTIMLMDYFRKNPLPIGCRVLEIGSGWGITGIYLAKQFHCDVTAVDIDKNVFPFLHHHADLNRVDIDCVQRSYDKLTVEYLSTFDIIVGGDICFWDELSKKLFKVIKRAMRAQTRTVLCDPGRQPFYQLVERCETPFDPEYIHYRVNKPRQCEGYILDVGSQFLI